MPPSPGFTAEMATGVLKPAIYPLDLRFLEPVPYLVEEVRNRKMLPNTIQLISQAIKEKRCIAIRYHDQRQIRVVEPHAVYTDERGDLSMDAYQTRGHSASGRPPPFWRPFRLKKITAVSVLKEKFSRGSRKDSAPTVLNIAAVWSLLFRTASRHSVTFIPPRPRKSVRNFLKICAVKRQPLLFAPAPEVFVRPALQRSECGIG
jgi:hypothetical protein